jgi:hypothetical protein
MVKFVDESQIPIWEALNAVGQDKKGGGIWPPQVW